MLGLPVGKFLKISPRSSTIRDRDGAAPLSERDLVELGLRKVLLLDIFLAKLSTTRGRFGQLRI